MTSILGAQVALSDLLSHQTLLQLFSGDFLQIALVFFVLAIIAALVGARGVAGISMQIAKWFVIIFIVLAIISLVL